MIKKSFFKIYSKYIYIWQNFNLLKMILKRILTRKSILGYGYSQYRDLSVQMLLDLGQQNILINSYFKLSKIDFIPEILEELGISEKYRIEKPGKNEEMMIKFYKDWIGQMTDLQRIKYYSKKKKQFVNNSEIQNRQRKYTESKFHMKQKNQGK